MAAVTIFIALVLAAMQVGLASDALRDNASFQLASYGFTVFAILGPICAFSLLVLRALLTLSQGRTGTLGGWHAFSVSVLGWGRVEDIS